MAPADPAHGAGALDLSPTIGGAETALPLFEDEHESFRDTCRDFVATEITPHVEAWERAEDFPRELFRTVGGAGLFGMKFPEDVGGSGPDLLAQAVWVEELARCGSGGVGADLGAHSDLASLYVDRFGSDAQRQRWLTPSIRGEVVGALGITEPDAGSDVAGIRTRATRDGSDWILSGTKVYITNGAWCDYAVVAAKTDPDAGHAGISLFVVEAGDDGFERNRMKMLGWRTSHTGELVLEDVRLPDDRLLGGEGRGFHAIMRNFAWERVTMALGAVVGAELALETAIDYATDREAFGRPVASFQVWRHRFADMGTRIATGRALAHHALRLTVAAERDPDAVDDAELRRTVSMAKLATQRTAFDVADECVQVHGGAGYMMEYPAQRLWRDARLGPIGGGTDEIMREIIAGTYGL